MRRGRCSVNVVSWIFGLSIVAEEAGSVIDLWTDHHSESSGKGLPMSTSNDCQST